MEQGSEVGLAHSHYLARHGRTTRKPPKHSCAQVSNDTRHLPKRTRLVEQFARSTLRLSSLPTATADPVQATSPARSQLGFELPSFQQLRNDQQPARWDRWQPTLWTWSTRSQIVWCAFQATHNSRSTAVASRYYGYWGR